MTSKIDKNRQGNESSTTRRDRSYLGEHDRIIMPPSGTRTIINLVYGGISRKGYLYFSARQTTGRKCDFRSLWSAMHAVQLRVLQQPVAVPRIRCLRLPRWRFLKVAARPRETRLAMQLRGRLTMQPRSSFARRKILTRAVVFATSSLRPPTLKRAELFCEHKVAR